MTTTSTDPALEPVIHHDRDGVAKSGAVPEWAELTARAAALCRQDRQRWQACADRSDELEAQGLPAIVAVRTALDELQA